MIPGTPIWDPGIPRSCLTRYAATPILAGTFAISPSLCFIFLSCHPEQAASHGLWCQAVSYQLSSRCWLQRRSWALGPFWLWMWLCPSATTGDTLNLCYPESSYTKRSIIFTPNIRQVCHFVSIYHILDFFLILRILSLSSAVSLKFLFLHFSHHRCVFDREGKRRLQKSEFNLRYHFGWDSVVYFLHKIVLVTFSRKPMRLEQPSENACHCDKARPVALIARVGGSS